MARALLCMGLSGLQGTAPGSLAAKGLEEAAEALTQESACPGGDGVCMASFSSGLCRQQSRDRTELGKSFKMVCFACAQLGVQFAALASSLFLINF